ncbi:MAG: hypothetical protein OHK0015_33910 [Chloroflexi bacterium OHK40]
MIPDQENVEQSVRRVRRGCLFIALLLGALAVLFTSATGNLAFLLLLAVAVVLFGFSRLVQ